MACGLISQLKTKYLIALILLISPAATFAQTTEPITYTLSFPAPQTHYVTVDAEVPTGGKPFVEMMMAVWTPGSYLIREYARNVEDLAARSVEGKPLDFEKTTKNRWRISTGGARVIKVSYRVYSREMTVRTNWVENSFAMINGAPTFITLAEGGRRPHQVNLVLPAAWKTTMTAMKKAASGEPHHYVAEDFDTLVDSPIVAGNPVVYEFDVDGKKHFLVNTGDTTQWDGPRSARDAEKIVREQKRLWGSLPYDRYVFLNMITEAGGGLEHKNSTLMMTSRWATRTRTAYVNWLELVSHEFFHVWNVKRLRPVEIEPFDYEKEVYSPSLWVSEGVTSYYGDLLVKRAGLSTGNEYLNALSTRIQTLQTTPGRLEQPVELASFDAWIKAYRPDENSPNSSISYYLKGEVIAFLLDAKIRRATDGRKSLDDVMRLAYERYSGERGFTREEFRKTAGEVARVDLSGWFTRALETTEELDYAEALSWYGLRFRPVEADHGSARRRAWTGLVTKTDNGRLVVSQVRRGTPVYEAGLSVDDEVLAINDYRVRPEQLAARLDQYRPGERVTIMVARRDKILRLDVTLGEEPLSQWRLEPDPKATAEQRSNLRAWLGETPGV